MITAHLTMILIPTDNLCVKSTALAAVGAALATLLVTLLVLWVRERGRKPEAELTGALRELETRMDAMVRELTDTIERTQHEGQRTRMLGELAGSIDLDEVLNRVLEAAGAIEGVDAALITVAAPPGGEPIAATLGLEESRGPAADAVEAVAARIDDLAREVGVPRGLRQLGVTEGDLARLAEGALRDACMSTNPRTATHEQMVELFRTAL